MEKYFHPFHIVFFFFYVEAGAPGVGDDSKGLTMEPRNLTYILYKYINKQHLTIKHKDGFYILYISAGNEGADNGVKSI